MGTVPGIYCLLSFLCSAPKRQTELVAVIYGWPAIDLGAEVKGLSDLTQATHSPGITMPGPDPG
jgi:hypothetical protein